MNPTNNITANPRTWADSPTNVAQPKRGSIEPATEPLRVRDYTERIDKEIAVLQDELTRLRATLASVLPSQDSEAETPPYIADPSAGPLIHSLAGITQRLETTRMFVSQLIRNIQL